MRPEHVALVVGIIAPAATFLTWWVSRRDKAKDPLPKTTAELALAKEALGIIVASRDTMSQDLEVQKAETAQAVARLAVVEGAVTELRQSEAALHALVERVQSQLTAAARYIETLLRWAHQLHDASPPPRLPEGLRDLIDPTLHDMRPQGDQP